MRSELDDAKVTAYALGELGSEEHEAVGRAIGASEDAQAELAEIEETVAALREAFVATARHKLTYEQRSAIEAVAGRPRRSLWPPRRPWRVWQIATLAAAATATVVAVSIPFLLRSRFVADASRLGAPLATPPPNQQGLKPARLRLTEQEAGRLKALGYVSDVEVPIDEFEGLRDSSAPFTTEAYDHTPENPFVLVAQDPRSTFSVDVDTASYANVRRYLNGGERPPKGAVRIEELVNYFPYAYAPPRDGRPFAVHMDMAACPWQPRHRLVRIAIKGREVNRAKRPPSNLVFLLDVSGSMAEPNKLPLVQTAMRLLVNELGPRDRVAIVVYAGSEGLALPSTPATDRTAIVSAIESLSPGGSTHGSAGIRLAYETATANFIRGGINRVILATDGDFNVGVTDQGSLVHLIEQMSKTGVFLTTLGFGMGNLKDSTLEKLADHGNGNYAYIDSISEARKVLVEQVGATLVTIAKDVKLQVEFNPRRAKAFRLIGYENRVLAHQDFGDDTKDAGDIGAGHTVTALYEVVPPDADVVVPGVDPLKYQVAPRPIARADSGELLTLKLRYKEPDGQTSSLMEAPLLDASKAFANASPEFRFAGSVAAFGMILRDSPNKGAADLDKVRDWATASLGDDPGGLRREFLQLVEKAQAVLAH